MGPSRCSAKFAKIPSEACPWPTCSECRAMCPFCRCLLAFSRGALTILARFRDGWRNGGIGAGAEAGRGLPGGRGDVEHSGRGRGTLVTRVWGWCWWRSFLKPPKSRDIVPVMSRGFLYFCCPGWGLVRCLFGCSRSCLRSVCSGLCVAPWR